MWKPAFLVVVATATGLISPVSAVSIAETLSNYEELSETVRILKETGLDIDVLANTDKTFTFFAPTNQALLSNPLAQTYMNGIDDVQAAWRGHLKGMMKNHIVEATDGAAALTKEAIFDGSRTKLESMQDPILVSQIESTLSPKDATIVTADIATSNGVLHIVDLVLEPDFFHNTFSNLELQSEFGPDLLNPPRISLQMVTDFVGGRAVFDETRPTGTTQLGCRIRAFVERNMGQDYLRQTINGSNKVQTGELLNETRKEETIDQFLMYSFLPYNFYDDTDLRFYEELVDPVNMCGHMWITKRDGKLCFNNACVVDEDDDLPRREFLAANGYGFVLDRCLMCPGFSQMARYTEEYTNWESKVIADFLESSLWNRRDMSLSVGEPDQPITFLAPLDSYFDRVFKKDLDTVRLTTPKWLPHLRDLLSYYMIQGNYTADNLPEFPVQSIQGEMLNASDFQLTDMRSVDGMIHYVGEVSAPLSITDNVYDYAAKDPDYSTHRLWIDVVQLKDDLGTLLPITSMYVNNSVLEGRILPQSQLEFFLQSHMLTELYYCEDLRNWARENRVMKSMNNETWSLVINEENQPCFETSKTATFGGSLSRACVVKCDIPRRNGVVHLLSDMMVKTRLTTLEPTAAPTEAGPPGPTIAPTVVPSGPTVAPTPTFAPVRSVTSPPAEDITVFIGGSNNDGVFSSGNTIASSARVLALFLCMYAAVELF